MAVNRITGNILADNLQRGANLSIQGNLVYFDITDSRVGILTSTPRSSLDIGGNVQVGNVLIAFNGNISAGNVNINNLATPVANTDAATKAYVDTQVSGSNIGNFTFSNNNISLSTNPANITITPTGNSLAIVGTNSGFVVPVGNTDQRPSSAIGGTVRYNSSNSLLEFYNGVGWITLSTSGSSSIINQTVDPDGVTSVFTLSQNATSASIFVTINGVTQTPDVDYTVVNNLITFTTTPIQTDLIQIRFLAGITSTNFLSNASANALVRVNAPGDIEITASAGQNITATGNLNIVGSISATGNISGTYILGNGSQLTGIVTSSYGNSNVASYLPTYSGNISAGNISAIGNITGAYILGNGSQLTGIVSSYSNSNVALYLTSYSGNISANNLSATGNITGGNLSVSTGTITVGNIVNSNSNGVGNIGSATTYFNTVFARATSAQYADLAEKFLSDFNYDSGTVLVFGGDQQVTHCSYYADPRAAGVVSTNPAHLMNSSITGVALALAGQVPCFVVGPVTKGDVLTTSNVEGYACRLESKDWQPGVVIGKALETCGPGRHIINIFISNN